MADDITYPTAASSLPDASFRWLDNAGSPIDFSTGWSFSMKIGQPPNAAQITKTAGIVGSTGANSTANLSVSWSVNELATLTPGRWYFQITATYGPSGGKQRILTGSMRIENSTLA